MWVSCQAPFRIRAEVARLLELPESRVRVIAPDVGGGFGVKTGPYREDVLLAWLARRLARPVKWVATRREDQATTNQARGSVCEGELAARRGRPHHRAPRAHRLAARLLADERGGAASPWNHARLLPGAYVVPACDITVSGAVTTTAPVAAYRGAGRPEALLLHRAADRHRGARASASTPPSCGGATSSRPTASRSAPSPARVYDSGDYPQALDRALAAADYAGLRREQAERRARGEIVGIGVVVLRGALRARLGERHPSGRALGRGHRDHRIERPRPGARDHVRPGRGRSPGRHPRRGRRCSTATRAPARGLRHLRQPQRGARRRRAGARLGEVRDKGRRIAARLLEAAPEDVVGVPAASRWRACRPARDVEGGRHRGLRGRPGACRPATRPGSRPPRTSSPRPRCGASARWSARSASRATPAASIERLVWVDDAGTIINPLLAEGQLHGSLAQGLGQALMEAIVYDGDGQLLTGTLMDYAIPRADDMPARHHREDARPSPRNPLGAKGLGEAGCIAHPARRGQRRGRRARAPRHHPPGHAAHSRAALGRASLGVRSYIPTFSWDRVSGLARKMSECESLTPSGARRRPAPRAAPRGVPAGEPDRGRERRHRGARCPPRAGSRARTRRPRRRPRAPRRPRPRPGDRRG